MNSSRVKSSRQQSAGPGRRTWILDLDGTLMPTSELDNECYWRAVHEEFRLAPQVLDLASFPEVTDEALLLSWCRERLGRGPSADERERIRLRFLDLLRYGARTRPECFTPTAGLLAWLDRERSAGARLAVATGGWGPSARFKLERAGLDGLGLPLASSDDSDRRTEIMRTALRRSREDDTTRDHRPPTYLGDGPWDLAAADALGWAFVGIARGSDARRLRAEGARRILPDFEAF